jgi:hypothetical protein
VLTCGDLGCSRAASLARRLGNLAMRQEETACAPTPTARGRSKTSYKLWCTNPVFVVGSTALAARNPITCVPSLCISWVHTLSDNEHIPSRRHLHPISNIISWDSCLPFHPHWSEIERSTQCNCEWGLGRMRQMLHELPLFIPTVSANRLTGIETSTTRPSSTDHVGAGLVGQLSTLSPYQESANVPR